MRRKKTITSHLRQKMMLQQEVRTPDTAGGYVRSWEDVAEVWAEIRPISGKERIVALQQESEITHRLYLRIRSGVDAGQRLISDTRTFYIRSVTPIQDNEALELLAEERAGV